MQNRAAVLPVPITSDAGTFSSDYKVNVDKVVTHLSLRSIIYSNISLSTLLQCLSCGSSLAEQNSEAAGQSEHCDLPPEVGVVDKQALVEDWLNPESEGEFAPQVQHYKPGQAGPSDCACHQPGLPAQHKISKVRKIDIFLLILILCPDC